MAAMVMVPGSSGTNAVDEGWSRQLLSMGVAILRIDRLTGRGVKGFSADRWARVATCSCLAAFPTPRAGLVKCRTDC